GAGGSCRWELLYAAWGEPQSFPSARDGGRFGTKRFSSAERRRQPSAQCAFLDVDVLFLPQLARGCSRSSTAVPRDSSRKNTLPTGSALGFVFDRYISHLPQKSMLFGTAKMTFRCPTAASPGIG